MELGPSYLFLYVVGLSLSINNTLSPYLLGGPQILPDLRGSVTTSADALAHLAGAGASGTIGGVGTVSGAACCLGTFSGAVLLCSVYSDSLTSSSCTVFLPKPFLRNMPFLATNTLPSVFMVKGIPSGYSGITYKDTLIRFGNLFGSKCFTQTSHPQILRNDKFGFYPFHNSYGVVQKIVMALYSV
jgi:hypothetical protein